MTRTRHLQLLILALVIALLNAFKPLTVDDSVYYHFASHIAFHPDDPYGFLAWGTQPANSILAPPVLLYWWALAVRLFGDQPVLWKLWLTPFILLLSYTLHALGRRFVPGREMPFVVAVMLSPTLLPCWNLMLDLPALAITLFALVVFFRAGDRASLAGAAAAGIVAGLAMQTKYTGVVAPLLMLLSSAWFGRRRFALVASGLAALLFVGWETFIAWRYGDSHFLLGYQQFQAPLLHKFSLLLPLVGLVGSTACGGVFLGLAALGASRRVLVAAFLVFALAFGTVALVPQEFTVFLSDARRQRDYANLSGLVFGVLGVLQWGLLALLAWRLLKVPRGTGRPDEPSARFGIDGFLIAWLAVEVAGYFALSPYPAVRRVVGITVTSTLLAVRLAVRAQLSRPLVWFASLLVVPFGLLGFAADFNIYHAEKELIRQVVSDLHRRSPGDAIWFAGNGAFEFYSRQTGMKILSTSKDFPRRGDWLVVPAVSAEGPVGRLLSTFCDVRGAYAWPTLFPWRSRYQCGPAAWGREEGPVAKVRVYRVREAMNAAGQTDQRADSDCEE